MTTSPTQSTAAENKGGKLMFTTNPPMSSDQVLQSCSVQMPTGEYVYVAKKDLSTVNPATFFR